MQAVWNGSVVADANRDSLIYIEGNWYFPPDNVNAELLSASDTPYTCPWKGECQYFDIVVDGQKNPDAAFSYPHPLPSAIERLHKDFSGYVAFWKGVDVRE